MARPAKELEKLSLKLRETAFIEASNVDSVLRTFVRVAASKWKIELSEAELEVIAGHFGEDLGEIGACFGTFNFEREVKEDYAKDYEDDEEDS